MFDIHVALIASIFKMKIVIFSSSLLLLVTIMYSNFGPSIGDIFPVSKNFMIFERFICRTYDASKASAIQCRVKYIDRNHLKALTSATLTGPVTDLWLHATIYYKYNTYMKIATELWDDLCGWFDGKHKSVFLDFLRAPLFTYTNFNHSCPYSGRIHGKIDNISVQQFAFPQIMPAGRYRLDMNVTEGGRQSALFGGSIYFAISDHRVEIV